MKQRKIKFRVFTDGQMHDYSGAMREEVKQERLIFDLANQVKQLKKEKLQLIKMYCDVNNRRINSIEKKHLEIYCELMKEYSKSESRKGWSLHAGILSIHVTLIKEILESK
jgi:hypothetical protein